MNNMMLLQRLFLLQTSNQLDSLFIMNILMLCKAGTLHMYLKLVAQMGDSTVSQWIISII